MCVLCVLCRWGAGAVWDLGFGLQCRGRASVGRTCGGFLSQRGKCKCPTMSHVPLDFGPHGCHGFWPPWILAAGALMDSGYEIIHIHIRILPHDLDHVKCTD